MLSLPVAAKGPALALLLVVPAAATASTFSFSTGSPDGKIASASRPGSGAISEIESADDFVLTGHTRIDSAGFYGLIPQGALVQQIVVEIYRVFPFDSDISRITNLSDFSTSNVPTRVNSPSDVALDTRDSGAAELTFQTSDLGSFTVNNSIQPGGIHPAPGQQTGGNGPVTGHEVSFDVTFGTGFDLLAGHYFFVPQVQLTTGTFLWLSAPKPVVSGTGPFLPDLQSWTRDAGLSPDWLRIGTDIVGGDPAPTYNAAFSLEGETVSDVPLPPDDVLMASGLLCLGFGLTGLRRRARASTVAARKR